MTSVAFAQQLKQAVRADDVAVRTGGDEFVVLLPDASVRDAVVLAERLQAALGPRAVAASSAA